MPLRLLILLVLAGAAGPVAAQVELQLHYGALEKILARQMFSQDGRRYLRGHEKARCNFAYLEKPLIDAYNGKLRVRARFSGRSALNMFGACVGMGDSFGLTMLGTPYYESGALRFRDVAVTGDKPKGYYVNAVCRTLARSLAADFKYDLREETRRSLEEDGCEKNPIYSKSLSDFSVTQVRVAPDALVLTFRFRLAIR